MDRTELNGRGTPVAMEKHRRNENRMGRCRVGLITFLLFLLPGTGATADIYRYIDGNGVLHFTNVPVSNGRHRYIEERTPVRDNASRGDASVRYDAYIARASRAFDVEFFLLKAIIRVESSFDPFAVSRKGATGLMQIMPGNYALLRIDNPFDPWQNIMGGARYLRMMLERFDGQLPLALAAYNAGPGAVEKYRRIPPFPETLRYVDLVLKHYQEYKKNDIQPKGQG